MAEEINFDAFKDFEKKGWEQSAETFSSNQDLVTNQAIEPLLNAAGVASGSRHLDVACGPGFLVAEAAKRGADTTGIDFSGNMIAQANRLNPGHHFEEGDAESLSFGDETFDAITCSFGILHLAYPDKAFQEVLRVLKPGGRFSFMVWSTSDKPSLFNIVLKSVMTHGTFDVGLPPGPDIFFFSDQDNSRNALGKAGFQNIEFASHDLVLNDKLEGATPDEMKQFLIDKIMGSTARLRGLMANQEADAREKIFQSIFDMVFSLSNAQKAFQLPMPALLISAAKQ